MIDRAHAREQGDSAPRLGLVAVLIGVLVLSVVVVYRTAPFNGYVYYDDDTYVFNNPPVMDGLTLRGIQWAFTTGHEANWHPLTWIAHMADVQLFGASTVGHHTANLIVHAANALLLFLVLRAMTGAVWPSFFVAAVFALHPLNVESAAWIAARKNTLSTFFLFLTMLAYAGYVRRPGAWRYAVVCLWFILGLLSKPMLVTVPFALLLLDYWPLNRFEAMTDARAFVRRGMVLFSEKLPWLALAAVHSIITFYVQRAGHAMEAMEGTTLSARLENAVVAYVRYLVHLFWPANLSIIYPHPGDSLPATTVAGALLVVLVLSVLACASARRFPYVPVGWFWYLGTLVPTIGIVQVGFAAMADRNSYVPAIGIVVIVAWGVRDWLVRRPSAKPVVFGLGACVLVALGVTASRQVTVWRDSVTLFSHAIDAVPDNAEAHVHLGYYYLVDNRPDLAMPHLREALRMDPESAESHTNIGAALRMQGDPEGAIFHYEEALRLNPGQAPPHANYGVALLELGRVPEAEEQLREALRIDPHLANAHAFLGIALMAQGKHAEAETHLNEALRLQPTHARARAALQALLK